MDGDHTDPDKDTPSEKLNLQFTAEAVELVVTIIATVTVATLFHSLYQYSEAVLLPQKVFLLVVAILFLTFAIWLDKARPWFVHVTTFNGPHSNTGIKIYTTYSFGTYSGRVFFRLLLYGFAIAPLALATLYFLIQYFFQQLLHSTFPTAPVFFLGIVLATAGWITTVASSQKVSRRQHTVNLGLEHCMGDGPKKNAAVFLSSFPIVAEPLSTNDARKLNDALDEPPPLKRPDNVATASATARALQSLLNYYEFIAISIKNRDLDSEITFDFFRFIVIRFCEKTHRYIDLRRRTNITSYENLIDLYRCWTKQYSFPSKEFLRTSGPAPEYVGNRETKIYHRSQCPNLKRLSRSKRVTLTDHDHAKGEGYRVGLCCA